MVLDLLELPGTLVWLGVDAADLDAVGRAVAGHDEVALMAATTGPANIFATVLTRDAAALYRYLTATLTAVPGVTAVETSPALRHVKAVLTHYPATWQKRSHS